MSPRYSHTLFGRAFNWLLQGPGGILGGAILTFGLSLGVYILGSILIGLLGVTTWAPETSFALELAFAPLTLAVAYLIGFGIQAYASNLDTQSAAASDLLWPLRRRAPELIGLMLLLELPSLVLYGWLLVESPQTPDLLPARASWTLLLTKPSLVSHFIEAKPTLAIGMGLLSFLHICLTLLFLFAGTAIAVGQRSLAGALKESLRLVTTRPLLALGLLAALLLFEGLEVLCQGSYLLIPLALFFLAWQHLLLLAGYERLSDRANERLSPQLDTFGLGDSTPDSDYDDSVPAHLRNPKSRSTPEP